MSRQFCPGCGHENPIDARFCMECGCLLTGEPAARQLAAYPPPAEDTGPDWGAIAAAALAFLSLRHLSRRARGPVILITFFVLFFGCPMVCGFVMFVMDWFAQLIR